MTTLEMVRKKYVDNTVLDTTTNCFVWQGAVQAGETPKIKYKGRTLVASRVFYRVFVENVPRNIYVKRSCGNRLCVRVEHMRLATRKAENFVGEKNTHAKLNVEKVREIRRKLFDGRSTRGLGKEYKVSETTIRAIKYNRTWKNI